MAAFKNILFRRLFVSRWPARLVTNLFHKLYCNTHERTFGNTYWLGIPTLKCPLDLWVYQEIIHELRPDVIVETGTHRGGSALYLAHMLDLVDHGQVVTIDIIEKPGRPDHPRITYLHGSSIDDAVVDELTRLTESHETRMVILDSAHHRDHVLEEMQRYADLVTVNSYLVVEDTQVNGHPIWRHHGPGPMEAVEAFLQEDSRFEIDATREKFYLTFNPRGYLRKISDQQIGHGARVSRMAMGR
jgi:cephalosporin hydroxylase